MIFMLRPRSGPNQWVNREEYRLSPSVEVSEVADTFGNLIQRLVAPVGEFEIFTSAEVVVENKPQMPETGSFVDVPDLPHDVLVYLLPSRYCESDRFGEMATDIVGDCPPGYAQVVSISQWVQSNVSNIAGSSTYPVSAIEVNERREGVCRDLAQISIALCRALCIPARLVVGYMHELEPMDIHAWFEAFLGGRWYTFDPTTTNTNSLRIAIAHGRDSTDVAIYNQYGPLLLPDTLSVNVDVV
jgi:transglutaminase-like putative cysteine protease